VVEPRWIEALPHPRMRCPEQAGRRTVVHSGFFGLIQRRAIVPLRCVASRSVMRESEQAGDRSQADPSPLDDPQEWSELIDRLRPDAMIAMIASAMSPPLREHCSPEDIWQETLAHAWRDREQHHWEDTDSFRGWIFEIARNRIREAARRRAAQKRGDGRVMRRISNASSGTQSSAPIPARIDSVTPSRMLARGERRAAVQQALSELPPELREVMRLHVIEGLAMEAVAQQLDIGVSAGWHRFRKGLEICARILPGWTREGSEQ
jgi:RNA polymerase sigma factor (sigma-70 family)